MKNRFEPWFELDIIRHLDVPACNECRQYKSTSKDYGLCMKLKKTVFCLSKYLCFQDREGKL